MNLRETALKTTKRSRTIENFNWSQFSKSIIINIDLETVYNSWTKSEELEKWFLAKASFFSKENVEILPTENTVSENVYKWNWFAQSHSEEGSVINANGIDCIEFTFQEIVRF